MLLFPPPITLLKFISLTEKKKKNPFIPVHQCLIIARLSLCPELLVLEKYTNSALMMMSAWLDIECRHLHS